jgi:hypothetical protein
VENQNTPYMNKIVLTGKIFGFIDFALATDLKMTEDQCLISTSIDFAKSVD